jgi:hypothetical protein
VGYSPPLPLLCLMRPPRCASRGTYYQLGRVVKEQRQFLQARDYFLRALEAFVAYEDSYSAGIVLRSLARLWQASGDANLPAAVASILGGPPEERETLLRSMLEEQAG